MKGIDLLTCWYLKRENSNYRVIAIEEPFSLDLPGVPIPIIGAMDLVEEDAAGTVIITDFKTSQKAYSANQIDQNMQITIYQCAAKANGFADREIILRFDCLIKTKKPKFETYYTIRTEIDEKRLIKKIQQVWDGIYKEVFIPNESSFYHKTCQYRQHCDEWFLT